MRKVVVLPQPDGPSSVTNSPCADAQIDVVDGGEVAEMPAHLLEHNVRHPTPDCNHSAPTHFLITRSCTHLNTITITIIKRPITLTCSALPLVHSFSSTTDSTSESTE